MPIRPLLAALTLLAALAVAGCGDGGSDSSPGVEKAGYVDQVNAICEQSTADVEAAVTPIVEGAKPSEGSAALADALEASLPISRRAIAAAAALPRPAADEELLEGFFSGLADSIPVYRRMIGAIRSGDRDALGEITADFGAIAAETRPVAEDYGLSSCVPDAPSP